MVRQADCTGGGIKWEDSGTILRDIINLLLKLNMACEGKKERN